jgi:hypothetical protein
MLVVGLDASGSRSQRRIRTHRVTGSGRPQPSQTFPILSSPQEARWSSPSDVAQLGHRLDHLRQHPIEK